MTCGCRFGLLRSAVRDRRAEPDPASASGQVEFRESLRELMRWAGCDSLQQLETKARRHGVSMPVSTADRALSTDRLPTSDFVRRFATACGATDVARWVGAREALADLKYARDRPQPRRPDPVEDDCPYPGLAAFSSAQARWFFGRERSLAEVAGHLAQ